LTVGVLLAGLVVLAPSAPSGADGNESIFNATNFRNITAGSGHTCAITSGGAVKCWGLNNFGQLGLGDTDDRGDEPGEMGDDLPAVDLGTGRTATAISAGDLFTCALLDNGTVKCWGLNTNGTLGQESFASSIGGAPGEMGDDLPAIDLGAGRTATRISAGSGHVCAILDNSTLKCWGFNGSGQLGLGNSTARGQNPTDMGDDLPAVALGTGRTATAVSAGQRDTCAILDNGSVKCWGEADNGRLGYGGTGDRGDEGGEMGDSLPAVDLGTGRTAAAISTAAHTCAVLDDATVKCWGRNANGQLGLGDNGDRGDAGGEMGDALPAVDLGTGRTAEGVTTGGDEINGGHTCALLDDASVKCWGSGGSGRTGLGNTDTRGDGANEMGDDLPEVDLGTAQTSTGVTAGKFHTCIRTDGGELKCWGENGDGQLGQGDDDDRGDGGGEMGDDLAVVVLVGGAPPPMCDGQVVTVNLNEAETPTAGADVILGTPVGETINALGGADRICAGGGNDTVNAGPGADRVFGQGGNDTLRGGDVGDRLDGGVGNDTLSGDAGNDTLLGQVGNDAANGGTGNDTATGHGGNDRLNGQAGGDTLAGSSGADTLDGGAGNDRLNGGTQRDTCRGSTGTDTQAGCEVRAGIP
jgi:alpha-tubulin suppressor-like RCC1 family protein